jgi:hypothetical protein
MSRRQNSKVVLESKGLKKGDKKMKNRLYREEFLSSAQSGSILENHKPFSYVLGKSKYKNRFIINWVQQDENITKSHFKYNAKTQTWFYKNGSPHHCKSFEELLSTIFHCSKEDICHSNEVIQ